MLNWFCGANYLVYLSIVIKARKMIFQESLQNFPARIANLEEDSAKNWFYLNQSNHSNLQHVLSSEFSLISFHMVTCRDVENLKYQLPLAFWLADTSVRALQITLRFAVLTATNKACLLTLYSVSLPYDATNSLWIICECA